MLQRILLKWKSITTKHFTISSKIYIEEIYKKRNLLNSSDTNLIKIIVIIKIVIYLLK